MSTRAKALLLVLVINIITAGGITFYTAVERGLAYFRHVDAQLQMAAMLARIVHYDSLSPERPAAAAATPAALGIDAEITQHLSTPESEEDGVTIEERYVITRVNGKIVFLTRAAGYHEPFDEYKNPPQILLDAFDKGAPTKGFYEDSFGRWRSVFLPFTKEGTLYVAGADVATNAVEQKLSEHLTITLEIGIAGFLISSLIGLIAVNAFTRRLGGLRESTYELVKSEFRPSDGWEDKLTTLAKKKDDVALLARSFKSMNTSLQGHIAELKTTVAAKERMEGELRVARDIQLGLLPKTFPAFPDRPELDLRAFIQPAKEVGGDLYDFFWIDEYRLFFVIGDVSDKGVHAALFMAVTRTLMKTNVLLDARLCDVLSKVNDELVENNESLMFVTLFCAILDVRTGVLEYCDGGHNAPYMMRAGKRAAMLEKTTGIALGFMPGFEFQVDSTLLMPGDAIFLYTDGVTEAMNGSHSVYGEERLEETLTTGKAAPLADLLDQVMGSIHGFVQEAPQSDDIAMLVLRYSGEPAAEEALESTRSTPRIKGRKQVITQYS